VSSKAVRRSLQISVVDGVLHAIMVGASESYLIAFAVELGHRDASLALLVTLPLVCGALAQLCASSVARLLGSRKRLVVAAAALQSLSHVAFISIAVTGDTRLWPLLAANCAFFTCGHAGNPAWGAWMGSLTKDVRRTRYFAIRSAILNIGLLVSLTSSGWLLDSARKGGTALVAFAMLQGVGLAMRLASAGLLALQSDPDPPPPPRESLPRRLHETLVTSRWRAPVYYAGLMFGTYMAAPFFAPYMLRVLHLDFVSYSVLTATTILFKALAFPLCHRVAARVGLRTMLVLSGTLVAVVPLAWWGGHDFFTILPIQALSGVAWAAMEFTNFQLQLHASKPEHRLELMSLANSAAGLSQLTGSLVGSRLLGSGALGYVELFVVSGLTRLIPLALFVPLIVRRLGYEMRGRPTSPAEGEGASPQSSSRSSSTGSAAPVS
jgi:hypothetical protein